VARVEIVIEPRFCGPEHSGNGGFVSGRIGGYLHGAARVRLAAPPPLATPLRVQEADEAVTLLDGSNLVATAWPADVALPAPEAPSLEQAERAAQQFAGFAAHPFPRCFVCGPQRAPGDGLRIFAGPVAGRDLVAAPWTPHPTLADTSGRVAPEFVWAALDCPGAFAVWPEEPGAAMVLGQLTVRVDALPAAGEPTVVVGWPVGMDGRKRRAGTALYRADGTLLAVGEATWITVPADRFAVAQP
jgi:hypothetical protein